MFVNDEEVGAHKTHGTDQAVTMDWDRRTFFGRALTNMRDERYVRLLLLLCCCFTSTVNSYSHVGTVS